MNKDGYCIDSVKKTLILILYLFKSVWSAGKQRVFVFFIPLGIMACIGYLLGTAEMPKSFVQPFNVGLVNLDQTFETRTMIQQFTDSKELKNIVTMVDTDQQSAISGLKDNRFASVIIIPKDFSHDLSIGKNAPVRVLGNRQRPLESLLVKSVMQSTADFITAAESGVNTVYHYLKLNHVSNQEIEKDVGNAILTFSLNSLGRKGFFQEQQLDDPLTMSPFQYYFFTGLIILCELWAFMLISFFQEQTNDLFEKRLMLSGIKPRNMVFAIIAVLSLTNFLQVIPVLSGFSYFIHDFNLNVFIAFGGLIFAISSLFTLLNNLVRNSILHMIIGLTLIMLSAFWGGGIIPLAYLPETFEKFSYFSLNKWGYDLIRAASDHTISWLSLAILLIITVTCFSLADYLYAKRMAAN